MILFSSHISLDFKQILSSTAGHFPNSFSVQMHFKGFCNLRNLHRFFFLFVLLYFFFVGKEKEQLYYRQGEHSRLVPQELYCPKPRNIQIYLKDLECVNTAIWEEMELMTGDSGIKVNSLWEYRLCGLLSTHLQSWSNREARLQ